MTILEKLSAIQVELKAPKTQFNKFGGYAYRKAEDIQEAVKPLLKKYGCTLTCSDELQLIGDRYYIRATACLSDIESGQFMQTNGWAREEEEKKGMDGSQITGSSSSYARKYALNGLLCIDDTQDSDTTNTGETPAPKKAPAKKAAPKKEVSRETWISMIARNVVNGEGISAYDAYVQRYRPTPGELADLEGEVEEFKKANGLI